MNPFEKLIQVTSVESSEGRAVLTTAAHQTHFNDTGTVHGGFIASLLDAASGYAGLSVLPTTHRPVAAQLNVNFIRPVSGGQLRASARVVKQGMQVLHIESDLADAQGTLLAQSVGIWLIQRVPAST